MWQQYLDARMNLIKEKLAEGHTTQEIYELLQVHQMQVVVLCMNAKSS